MLLPSSARVAVVGAGPGGLVTAKHAIEAGFEVAVFEASDDLGGQWHSTAAHSGVWPGMRTNTSRMMTAFSDFPPPPEHELNPLAEQVQAYLRRYAESFGLLDKIRFSTAVMSLEPGWLVNGEPFDAVVVASGRFRAPQVPPALRAFSGTLLHSYDYPGAAALASRQVLVYGNGVSGHEIASDLAEVTEVISAYRKPRYVLQKVAEGVPSDWRWFTHLAALQREHLPAADWGRLLRERVVRLHGNPVDFGAPQPDDDILVAGQSLCQDYLAQVRDGRIVCRPAIASVDGNSVTFTDGSTASVDVIVCATGYRLDLPFLPDAVRSVVGPDLRLYERTLHPDLPALAFVGQFALQGPYFPLLELQARLIVGAWSGCGRTPHEPSMRAAVLAPPAMDVHHVLALRLAEAAGVAPDLTARPELTEALVFGPMLPPRYRLDGPGALPDAAQRFALQLASSPRPPVDPADVELLTAVGLAAVVPYVGGSG
jgi:cation diffusion facilitator CzcD-associated flavoprotein CzcO